MMNKRVLNSFLYGALLFSLGTGVVSCKDYDSDIEGLNNRITTVESDMDRFKEKIEAALNANLTVQSWYPSEDQSQYTIVLSNGDELYVQASNKATPFYQFKVEEGTWRYTKDKGAGWYKVLTFGTEQEIPGTDKDQLYYDKSNGYIYIQKTEGLVQTTITADKDTPILAENKENKTLSVYIYGENYILPVQGGGFSGISSILFQKQFVFEEDEFLEAASYTNKLGKVVTAHTATAKFKILPKDIDLSEADFQCADIHELKLTRAEVPQLLVNTNKKLDENGILTVELTPSNMTAPYYGAVLEITLDKTTTSSNYFVVKPTSYSASNGLFAYRETRTLYQDSESLKFISTESLDLAKTIGWGFGESGEVKFVDELGFGELAIETTYELTENPNNTFEVTDKGVLTAKAANRSGKVKVTYTVAEEEFSKEVLIYSQDESTAKNGIELKSSTVVLSDIESLYKGTKVIKVENPQTTLENLGVTASKTWKLGTQLNGGSWETIPMTTNLATITQETELANGEVCLYYDAAQKASYLLVGPQAEGMTGANLFAMNDEGTDKAAFTLNEKEVGLYIGNVTSKYVVEAPTKKPELNIMIYGKAGINNETPSIRLGERYTIPGVYDETEGYHFTNVDLRKTLYNFKPADAEFTITLNKNDQNTKVKERWDANNVIWDAANYTLTLVRNSPHMQLFQLNFNDKKINEMNEADNGLKFSWTFNAGKGEVKSEGNEQWYIKDPVRQPGEHTIYMGSDKQPNATGVVSKDYEIKVSEITGDDTKTKMADLEVGKKYYLGNYFKNHAFWTNGCSWDVYGGPKNLAGTQLPVLLKYDSAGNKIVMTDYCKKYFCKQNYSLVLDPQGNETSSTLDVNSEEQSFTLKIVPTTTNFQFKFTFISDYSSQNMFFRIIEG